METELVFVSGKYFGEMKERAGGVADSDDGAGVKCGLGQEVVVRRRGILGGAKGSHVNDRALKGTA